LTEAFRDIFLVEDAYGKPVAVLTRKTGASDEDLKKFYLAHIENAVSIRNFAEIIEAELETSETKNRIAELTKVRRWETTIGTQVIMNFTEPDARLKIVNEIVDRYQNVIRFSVQPRTPQPKPDDGERGRQLAAQAMAAQKAANAYPPKLETLLV
jgi:flagellar biosynthesis component FlhA